MNIGVNSLYLSVVGVSFVECLACKMNGLEPANFDLIIPSHKLMVRIAEYKLVSKSPMQIAHPDSGQRILLIRHLIITAENVS